MRLCAVDASVEDARVEQAIALCLREAPPTRLFLFRAAARVAARELARLSRQADDRFLDSAAEFLMQGTAGAPPVRGAQHALTEMALCVGGAAAQPLTAPPPSGPSARWSCAANWCASWSRRPATWARTSRTPTWITGGAERHGLESRDGRALLAPGDVAVAGHGAVLVLEHVQGDLVASFLDVDGGVLSSRPVLVGTHARMSVQG